MNELRDQFIVEARELIHQATDDLIAAERDGFTAERIDRVFRAFHTLKGSAGVVDLPAMGLVLHAAEDLLGAIQGGRLGASQSVIDQALACLDQVAEWVDEYEANETLSPAAGDHARAMTEALRNVIAARGASDAVPAATAGGPDIPDWVGRLAESCRATLPADMRDAALLAFGYEPLPGCFFNGDDPLALVRQVPRLLALHIEPRQPWPPLAQLDPFNCNMRIQGISAADRGELANVFRLVPDQIRIVAVPSQPSAPLETAGDPGALVRAVLLEQITILGGANDGDRLGRIGSAGRVAANALRHAGDGHAAQGIERAGALALSQSDVAPLLSATEQALRSQSRSVPSGEDSVLAASRSLRVDEARIDTLVDLAGELLVAKNRFAHLAKRADAESVSHALAQVIKDQHAAIERLANELHGGILQLRMVPVARVFRSFPRLVRDMSHRLGKNVALVVRGETTESDKAVVDLLFEPLMHLVRNALDHGIEAPEERRAAGKPVPATISLEASRVGDRCVIAVSDDGRGIDPAAIRSKAGERALLPADELAAMTDEQVIDLIFAAGFSTAAQVTDISGRGVGMDVVRAAVEKIGGNVSIASRVGAGTTVSLDLPMSIAMSRVMVVEAAGERFGIPMDAVSETVRLTPDRISRFKNNDGFVLHDRVVPICPLAELMKLPAQEAARRDVRLVVVAEAGGKTAAIEVDAIRDRLDVVLKPMQGLLANARGYAGTTLLGDGAVLLVLDLKEIMP